VKTERVGWFRAAGIVMLSISAVLFLAGVGIVVSGNELALLLVIVAFGGLVSGFGLYLARGHGG
jgi:hypothetical protein